MSRTTFTKLFFLAAIALTAMALTPDAFAQTTATTGIPALTIQGGAANGQTYGEVVVVNEKFGIRLTDVISPAERIRKLK